LLGPPPRMTAGAPPDQRAHIGKRRRFGSAVLGAAPGTARCTARTIAGSCPATTRLEEVVPDQAQTPSMALLAFSKVASMPPPTLVITPMQATLMSAAISPYS